MTPSSQDANSHDPGTPSSATAGTAPISEFATITASAAARSSGTSSGAAVASAISSRNTPGRRADFVPDHADPDRRPNADGERGVIINTASIAGKQGYEPLAHYSASKFAVVALTQAAARAFGKDRITVNAICPGVVATDMWKLIDRGFRDEGLTSRDNEAFEGFSADILLGRASQAGDLAGVAVFLASAGSDYMTGQSLVVDGGMVLI